MNGVTEEADPRIYSSKVIHPWGAYPTQIECQAMIEIVEEENVKGEDYHPSGQPRGLSADEESTNF